MLRRLLTFGLCCASGLVFAGSSEAAFRARTRSPDGVLGVLAVSETSWVVSGLPRGQTFELASAPWAQLLERYLEPYRNHTPEWRTFFRGQYGPARAPWLPELCWSDEPCSSTPWTARGLDAAATIEARVETTLQLRASEPLFVSVDAVESPWAFNLLRAPAPELLNVARRRPCPRWKAPQPVTVVRWAGEVERLTLTDCDGAIAGDALDRLSVLARPPGAPRPELPLPIDPEADAGEWTPEVMLLKPRLVWAVSEIARAFPKHSIVVMSGYRRDGHSGFHGKAQALDLYVTGVPNEEVFAVCRALPDAGCGYYPNNRFVHLDVRTYGSGRVTWVDISAPGETSQYVDGWPSVLPPGIAWLGGN